MQPTPILLPGKSLGWRSLAGCSPWGRKESDTTEQLTHTHSIPLYHWIFFWILKRMFLPPVGGGCVALSKFPFLAGTPVLSLQLSFGSEMPAPCMRRWVPPHKPWTGWCSLNKQAQLPCPKVDAAAPGFLWAGWGWTLAELSSSWAFSPWPYPASLHLLQVFPEITTSINHMHRTSSAPALL